MKYIISRILLVAFTFIILGCKEDTVVTPVPSTKTEPKETQILFSEVDSNERGLLTYYYLIQGYDGIFKVIGFNNCMKTFKIDIGKPYTVTLNHIKDRPIIINDLCEMTVILKRDNPNM